ncbi:plasmid pRiA4b ORF-3 family protein [Escherichia coli]|nr:plasmid pRiA4b ORF-3 family protein [Escherichia coli]EFE4871931.1 plasmid pRiA4b ORF-3 family protein [Escherichia coli]
MKVYVIKIAVRGVSPMVWRRLRIAADTSLAALHFIIQIIQGWGDDHLHQFLRDKFASWYPGCTIDAQSRGTLSAMAA